MLTKIMSLAVATALTTSLAMAQATPSPASPIHVIAEVDAKPEAVAAIRTAMSQLSARARSEKGCLSYAAYEDREHAGHFLTYETWADDAALSAHLTSPAMKSGTARLGPMLARAPTITRLNPL